ncbi:MAG: hypothetical protein QW478_14915, partial [Candidatus Micrarchaeaceae archaeon]
SSLLKAVPNSYSLESNLKLLSEKGLVKIREEVIIRRTYFISLTERGRAVAIQLKKADEMITGSLHQIDELSGKTEMEFRDLFDKISQLFSVKTYDDHSIIEDSSSKEKVTILLKNDEKGVLRLWCEKDQSFVCFHTKYCWSLPEVQSMYFYSLKNEFARTG